jgi:hypothetical protein
MFEAEEELESESRSSALHVLIIVIIVGALACGGVYWYLHKDKPPTFTQAAQVMQGILKAQGPATVRFQAGIVERSREEDPSGPQYKLLEKAGYIKTKPNKKGTEVIVTDLGDKTFSALPEFNKEKNKDGSLRYTVPLATRKLVEVTKVTPIDQTRITVEYTWKWDPNKVGDDFDATGKLIQQFSTWDRGQLIQKFGADFYHGEPNRTKVTLIRSEKGWKLPPQ